MNNKSLQYNNYPNSPENFWGSDKPLLLHFPIPALGLEKLSIGVSATIDGVEMGTKMTCHYGKN